jgi:hypothetical protein
MLGDNIHLFWATPVPDAESDARILIGALSSTDLLIEPFERTVLGIDEAFAQL